MISSVLQTSTSNFVDRSIQLRNNICRISKVALPLLLISSLPIANAGVVSYTACIATCPALAAAAPPGLFQYTFESCMIACNWMLSPTCP